MSSAMVIRMLQLLLPTVPRENDIAYGVENALHPTCNKDVFEDKPRASAKNPRSSNLKLVLLL